MFEKEGRRQKYKVYKAIITRHTRESESEERCIEGTSYSWVRGGGACAVAGSAERAGIIGDRTNAEEGHEVRLSLGTPHVW